MTTPLIVYYSTIWISRIYIFILFYFKVRKYTKQKLNIDNLYFVVTDTRTQFVFLFSIVYLLGTVQEACFKPSRRIFAFYLLGYLSLVISPSVGCMLICSCAFRSLSMCE